MTGRRAPAWALNRSTSGAAAVAVVFALLANAPAQGAEARAEEAAPPEGEMPEGDAAYSRNDVWLGVGGAFVLEDFDRTGFYDNTGAVSFRAGIRGTPILAVELLGEVMPNFDSDREPDGDVDAFAVTANGKLFLPLGRVEPFVMAGVGFLDVDADNRSREDDFAFRFAAGFDAYLTPNWALYFEAAYMLPTGDVEDYRYSQYGAGILFKF